jgi:hypothetical protein
VLQGAQACKFGVDERRIPEGTLAKLNLRRRMRCGIFHSVWASTRIEAFINYCSLYHHRRKSTGSPLQRGRLPSVAGTWALGLSTFLYGTATRSGCSMMTPVLVTIVRPSDGFMGASAMRVTLDKQIRVQRLPTR